MSQQLLIRHPGLLAALSIVLMNLSLSLLASLFVAGTASGRTVYLDNGTPVIVCDLDGFVQDVLVEEGQSVRGAAAI